MESVYLFLTHFLATTVKFFGVFNRDVLFIFISVFHINDRHSAFCLPHLTPTWRSFFK